MTNRMDNLQTVFDRTDWSELAKQKAALIEIVANQVASISVGPIVLSAISDDKLQDLLNWLIAVQDAAEMDGYQVKAQTDPDDDRYDMQDSEYDR